MKPEKLIAYVQDYPKAYLKKLHTTSATVPLPSWGD